MAKQSKQRSHSFFTFLLGYDDLVLLVSVLLALISLSDGEELLLPSPLLGRLWEEILKEVQGVEQSLRVQVDVQGGEGHLTRGKNPKKFTNVKSNLQEQGVKASFPIRQSSSVSP